ncbi:hypothetical protein BLSTO_00796 [Blastocystis sp. subtype 1]
MTDQFALDTLKEKAEEYIRWDPVVSTREEISQLLKEEDWKALEKAIMHRLAFGTAGLRGRMGAGYNCMNDLVVLQTAQGICEYLLQQFGEDVKKRGVVVGYDHRALGDLSSKSFFLITAKVFQQKGIPVYGFNSFAFTPLVPFSISAYNCCAGIMITASHNPAADDGYKIYWENACQIISPHDKNISACIQANLAPWTDYAAIPAEEPLAKMIDITESAVAKYMAYTTALLHRNAPETNARCPAVMYTAMHGVGGVFVRELLSHFHLPPVRVVQAQLLPDPTFPTVAFPNPEEKGALKLALEEADKEGVKYVFATDPDADRFICAERGEKGWHVFKGDEIGAIFGYYMCTHTSGKRCLVNSVVSSRWFVRMGERLGVRCEQTLTGFKWMGNKQWELEKEGFKPLLTYEEAIGYAVGGVARDKDGVSALAVMGEIVAELATRGSGLLAYLEEIYQRFGYSTTRNSYVISRDEAYTNAVFARLRNGGNYLFKMGDYRVAAIRDLTTGYDSAQEANGFRAVLPVDPASQMITFDFANGACLTLRTSGTEPKIKYYMEVMGEQKEECEKEADAMEKAMLSVVFDKECVCLLQQEIEF